MVSTGHVAKKDGIAEKSEAGEGDDRVTALCYERILAGSGKQAKTVS